MRNLVHLVAALGLAAVAVALGRWLRDPEPGAALLAVGAAAALCALALRRLYRPGGLARGPAPAPAAPPSPAPPAPAPRDDRLDLNTASAAELQRLPGIGRIGAERIVAERERNGPFETTGDLVRVTGFGPSRVRALAHQVRAG